MDDWRTCHLQELLDQLQTFQKLAGGPFLKQFHNPQDRWIHPFVPTCPCKAVPISSGQWATPCTVHQSWIGQQRQTWQPRVHSLNLDINESCFRGRWENLPVHKQTPSRETPDHKSHAGPSCCKGRVIGGKKNLTNWSTHSNRYKNNEGFFCVFVLKRKGFAEVWRNTSIDAWRGLKGCWAHSSLSLFLCQGLWFCGAAGR